jgi:replicative DNA helicase
MGKSALVANTADNAAAGHVVVIFSLEMSEAELSQRFIGSNARVQGEHLHKGKVSALEWPKIVDACARLSATRMSLTIPATPASSKSAPRRGVYTTASGR